MPAEVVESLENRIRELTREREVQRAMPGALLSKVTQALDANGDAQAAIDAHERLSRLSVDDFGFLYLAHFGFLQALYLQQRAVSTLCSVFNVPTDALNTLKHVRDRRDDVAHMTDRNRGGARWIGIVRASMTVNAFEVYAFHADGTYSPPERVECTVYVSEQRAVIETVLKAVIADLEQRILVERSQFTDRLAAHFQGIRYAAEKISCAFQSSHSRADSDWHLAKVGLDSVRTALSKLHQGLEARRILEDDELMATDIAKAETIAKTLLESIGAPRAGAIESEALARYLSELLTDLEAYAREIDTSYAEYSGETP